MSKLILAACLAASLAAPTLAQTPMAFTWEGHHIIGTADQVGDTQILKGRDLTTGRDFELHVRRGYVEGTVGDTLVSYPAPRHAHTAIRAD